MKANSNESSDKEESESDMSVSGGTKTGIAEESKEHPWLTAAQIKHLVSDHLAMDPEYYEDD
jgi:hypothetical protein